jgi:hypothetical protein
MSLPHEIAEQQARCDEYNRRIGLTEAEPAFANELDYLEYVWRDPTKPDRLRYMAAKACADFHYPTLKAVAQIKEQDMAAVIDAARARAASVANVISLKVVPKAIQHDAAELKPDPARSPGAQSPNGFRRRF